MAHSLPQKKFLANIAWSMRDKVMANKIPDNKLQITFSLTRGTKVVFSKIIPFTSLPKAFEELESSLLVWALSKTKNNRSKASLILGLNRTTLVEKLRRRKWLKRFPSTSTENHLAA